MRTLLFAALLSVFAALAQEPAPAPLPEPERSVAEWIIRMGGAVTPVDSLDPVRMLDRLPQGNFRIAGADFTGTLDQPIFQPTTVFSYYQPGYEVPGTKILGPAFGILSTATTLRRANDLNTLIYSGVTANSTPTAPDPMTTSDLGKDGRERISILVRIVSSAL